MSILHKLKVLLQKTDASMVNMADVIDNDTVKATLINAVGIATGGTKTTLIDTSKNFEVNTNAGKVVRIIKNGVTYYRTVVSNTLDTQTFSPALPGAASVAVVGLVSAGQVTVVCTSEGIAGNLYTIRFIKSPGNSANLSSSLAGTVLTVYLGTDVAGDLDNAKNTAALIAASISQVPGFSATSTGIIASMIATEAPVAFSGGVNTVTASGSSYEILGGNFLGRSGARSFDIPVEIIRPTGTDQYLPGDLINTATNATVLPALDFTIDGGLPYDRIQIHSVTIISSNGAATTKLTPWISFYTASQITGQNLGDNQAFNVSYDEIKAKRGKAVRDDEFTTVGLGTNAYMSAAHELCREMKLDANAKLYPALRAMNAYTPASGEKFYLVVSGLFL